MIGGVAVSYHGYVRATKDLDIVPAPDDENLRRLATALAEVDGRPLSLGDFDERELPVALDADGLRQRGNWDIATSYGRLDVMQYVAGKLESDEDYASLRERASIAHYEFGDVAFVSYEDLLDFKLLAGRDQDLIDVRALREARDDIA